MKLHNLRYVLVTCVAVTFFLLAGCHSSHKASPPAALNPTASTLPTLGAPLPGYDEWVYWDSGASTGELESVLQQLDLKVGALPKAKYANMGFVGVALVGSGCMLTLSDINRTGPDRFSVMLLSRHTPNGLAVGQTDATIPKIKSLINKYRLECSAVTAATA